MHAGAELYLSDAAVCTSQLQSAEIAQALPSALRYFIVSEFAERSSLPDVTRWISQSATSLGGVESLIEQRARSDPTADLRLVRISVGVEDLSVRISNGPHVQRLIHGAYDRT